MRFTTVLFIFAIIFSVASTPSALGQTFTTVTNVMTTTGLFTSNVYSTNTIGTTTQTVVSSNTFISTTDTIPKATNFFCYYDWWNITIGPGTAEVTGTIGPPSNTIDFFIMSQEQYIAFKSLECGSSGFATELSVFSLHSTYSLDWKNPPAGWYYFIFMNENTADLAENSAITTPFDLVATLNQEQTSTVYNVVTNQVAQTATQTVSSTQVTQVATGINIGIDPTLIGVIIVVVIVVLAALYFVRSRPKARESRGQPRSSKSKETPTRVYDQETARAVAHAETTNTSNLQFCLNCGKPLPTGSKFCDECGNAQE